MNKLKNQILSELQKQEFPNLKFLYSKEALKYAPEVLEELLEIEKQKFKKLLKIKNEKLTFDILEDEGILDYYWSLLNHLKSVDTDKNIRKIIDDFRSKLQDFGNFVAYNQTYFKQLIFIQKSCNLNNEQKRSIFLRIKRFQDRGIDLNAEKQTRLKELSKEIAKLSDKFDNNIVDDEERFEYLIKDFRIITDLPKEVLEIAKQK
jgi:oligopeptidase A